MGMYDSRGAVGHLRGHSQAALVSWAHAYHSPVPALDHLAHTCKPASALSRAITWSKGLILSSSPSNAPMPGHAISKSSHLPRITKTLRKERGVLEPSSHGMSTEGIREWEFLYETMCRSCAGSLQQLALCRGRDN